MTDYIDSKDLLNLLYNKDKYLKTINFESFKVLLNKYEEIKIVLDIIDNFKSMLFNGNSSDLDKLI
ncbi:hypothetical protein K0040_15555 [Terrisporobacter petrolearius]|uniref:hypothetical protein n=1 Tax=Terrisporobacter petrolearius TaxID=1460447 RepID=UPI001D169095|nr:hypothetical protein [Terrisporobacter petrolearius]MCC3865679.1 hypothetical protein [Terrisporobacter petrolearius]